MEQHPVPQQISAYHFRLVGDMTIKQFLELIIGVIFAWVIYSLPISSLIRWPLVIFSVFFGVAFAFLPFEDRPLDKWLAAFIKSIYSPTKFIWRKIPVFPSFFEELPPRKAETVEMEQVDLKRLKEYLESLPSTEPQTAIDAQEYRFLTDIMNLYNQVQPITKTEVKPKPEVLEKIEQALATKVRVRKLKTPPLYPKAILRGEVIVPKRQHLRPKMFDIPLEKVPELVTITPPNPEEKTVPTSPTLPYDTSKLTPTGTIKVEKEPHATTSATLKPKLPIPAPTTPNVLVGMVIDNQGNIVDNAIVTIKDDAGNISRAQKTNKLGQFFIATPLVNGTYEIEVEKEALSFDIIKITLEGKTIQPLEIKANQ